MSRSPTRAELMASLATYRRAETANSLALTCVTLGEPPDFEATAPFRDAYTGDLGSVGCAAYRLHRADGGVVVLTWRFGPSRPLVEAILTLDFLDRSRRDHRASIGHDCLNELADQIEARHRECLRQRSA